MARIDSKLAPILLAIVKRLQTHVDTEGEAGACFDEGTCFLCLDEDAEPAPTPGGLWCTVTPLGGTVDDSLVDGGGREQTTCDAQVLVKIHSPVQLDEVGHDTQFLTNETLGVLSKMDQVLAALQVHDLQDGDGNEILRQGMFFQGWDKPRSPRKNRLGSIGLIYGIVFDWALT